MESNQYHNPIREHIYTIPSLVNTEIAKIFENCAGVLRSNSVKDVHSVILTGCGYSYAACLAAKQVLHRMTNLPVQVLPAIEVSRFTDIQGTSLKGILLVGISNSGEVSRINEALMLYRKHGAATIGVTGNVKGRIRDCCDFLLLAEPPALKRSLPLRGYAMTYLSLLAIAYLVALRQGRASSLDISLMISEVRTCMETLEQFLSQIDKKIFQYSKKNEKCTTFEFVGAGYERAAAFLGKIEMMGQAGIMAADEDTEQWLHCNFFMAEPETIGTMLFLASNSKAISRGLEALEYMIHLKRPVCVITDDPAIVLDSSPCIIHIPTVSELTAGLSEMIAPSLLTGYICEMKGEVYSRGFRDQWAIFRDGRGTTQSKIVVE